MRFRHLLNMFGAAFVCACTLSFIAPDVCEARRVDVGWQDSGPVKTRAQALGEAFALAAVDESLDILRVTLPEARRVALQEYLAASSSEFVRSYHEEGMTQVEGGGYRMSVEVDLNREHLKERLKQAGIYYTTDSEIPCNLQVSGDADSQARVKRLQLVAGIVTRPGASLRCVIKPSGKGWYGTLDDAGVASSASGATAEEVWARLWPDYLARRTMPATASGTQEAIVRVWGWLTPDGTEVFDKTLRDWDRALTGAALAEVSMRPDGMAGVWRVQLVDRAELERRLAEYATPRKLRFEISAP
ncbi:hypothetical protein [Nitratidesulfovibrio vulgaris]|uniref:Lipoprotein, putative n=1 Tax=Nitratidesulfovibrio vulgaris (strain DP4) TaxID=391774 RepID=A0A0H3AAU3_NITV4|nr:hypothetical protein [Nitratidesulfovibrio vulgaris]ABM28719.1 lipoprotein, putative [Nitratidesulfovibrio vulgaris DP4]WCB47913.1 hypothetical protein PH214_07450 [Nitratidesulfovibrio vulgaris]GEB79108.1 lipoprotein [Desulfovibrio desulfuricans]HBW15802.1 hypothetical protein [Desulfovibrio sp.]